MLRKVNTLKSKIVARGNTQEKGYDYFDTYSPTVEKATLRVFLWYCLQNNLNVYQLDVEAAFLQADLDEVIFMELPIGTQFYGGRKMSKACESVIWIKAKQQTVQFEIRRCFGVEWME